MRGRSIHLKPCALHGMLYMEFKVVKDDHFGCHIGLKFIFTKKMVVTVKPVSQVAITQFYITNIACVCVCVGGGGGVSVAKVIVNIFCKHWSETNVISVS